MEPTLPASPPSAARERAQKVQRLVVQARSLDATGREALLAEVEPDLADEVWAALTQADPGLPEAFGPYRPVKLLGEGGMGLVYLAEQEQPVRRLVALKLMQRFLRSARAVARFEAECQAMARLSHPNVGRLLDASAIGEATPFLVMEWIEGIPLDQYCDQHQLGLDARLELFVAVCRGVHHAHQKQILHRDLKPSNVLVVEVDGRPVPKIIDFGIAKALDEVATAVHTGDRVIGTLDYLSPEALEPGEHGADVDIRSDVYALGVMLYELLVGMRPFADAGESVVQAVRNATTAELTPPSARLAGLPSSAAAEAASRRGLDPGRLRQRLRADLDWVALKATARDREQRYSSAEGLAEDLERVLRGEPVAARPADRWYVARRFVRRHRGPLLAVAAVVGALLLGLVGTLVGLDRARAAQRTAEAEAARANQALEEADEVSGFLASLFRESQPGQALGRSRPGVAEALTARQILDAGATRIDTELADRPRVRARLDETIGRVYQQLALYDEAERHLRRAIELRRGLDDVTDLEAASGHAALGRLWLERGRLDEAQASFEEALRLAEAAGPDASKAHASAIGDLGRVARRRGDFEEAQRLLERALEEFRRLVPPDPEDIAAMLNNLGTLHFSRGAPERAEPLFAEAVAYSRQALPAGHPRLIQKVNNLAAALATQGKRADAAPLFEESLAARRSVLGDRHPDVAESLNNLGVLRQELGELEAAEKAHREALEIREEAFGPSHPAVAWSLDNLAVVRAGLGDDDEARRLQERALAIRRAALGDQHPEVARSLDWLARLAQRRGDRIAARQGWEDALRIRVAALGEDHRETARTRLDLGLLLWESDRRAARELLVRALATPELERDDEVRRAEGLVNGDRVPGTGDPSEGSEGRS